MTGRGGAPGLAAADVPDTLDTLMTDLNEHPDLGLVSPRWRRRRSGGAAFGTVDRPREQRRDISPSTSAAPAATSWSWAATQQRQEHPAAHHRHEHGR